MQTDFLLSVAHSHSEIVVRGGKNRKIRRDHQILGDVIEKGGEVHMRRFYLWVGKFNE
ncbi:hypothetical protein GCM10023183_02310 [Nibribacter koreensis]|uniref:Uncharacterized protein n=1 Tax=Nibribacter koreensis TaxID=1084519 RepID=A0ABP8F652_9BACT